MGYGIVSASNTYTCGYETTNTSSLSSYENTFAKGMCFGDKKIRTKHMRFLGIEDFWGNISQFIKCLTTNGSRAIIYSWSEDNGENVEAEPIEISSGYTSNFFNFPKYVQGTTDTGFMPRATYRGSSSTYWPDHTSLDPSSVFCFGGNGNDETHAGPFYINDFAASSTGTRVSARLLFL